MIFHYAHTANKFQLLIGLENSRDNASRPIACRPRPRLQNVSLERSWEKDRGLEDYKTVHNASFR